MEFAPVFNQQVREGSVVLFEGMQGVRGLMVAASVDPFAASLFSPLFLALLVAGCGHHHLESSAS